MPKKKKKGQEEKHEKCSSLEELDANYVIIREIVHIPLSAFEMMG